MRSVVEIKDVTVNIEPLSKSDQAFCAGFFEGRGSINVKVVEKPSGHRVARIIFEIVKQEREILDVFAKKMKVGTVRGPYLKQGVKVYVYSVSDRMKVAHIITNLWPWLGPHRRKQILHAVSVYNETRN